MPVKAMIPVNEPLVGERELEYVTDCVRSGWVSSSGRFLDDFERCWAEYCGRAIGVGVCNGTAALQLAVAALDLQPGDEVIIPTFTIISCTLAVVASGAMPVLVDSEPRTWTMDVEQVARKITPKTKAIMIVHIYGHPVDLDPVLALAQRYGLAVIEDAAEAHGAEYLSGRAGAHPAWRRCGGFGTLSCFSFYGNKLITTGEGGMVLTDDARLAQRLRSLRNLGFQPDRRFVHEELGFNFRLTNLQAALGLAQLERMPEIVARKREMGQAYTNGLKDVPGLQLPIEESWARSVYWMYGVVLREDTNLEAASVMQALRELGVDTRPFFLGMPAQPVFRRRGWFAGERYPVADGLAHRGFYLPSGLALTDAQLTQACEAVKEVLAGGPHDASLR